ncbi:hypothetical protein BS47DRAFT_1316810 [Hydnum rufescens UP504]|uniref:HlyIII-domain-containing protein n=1 Tax=Hydnum rufescens UP504 TaxID=1448309 RepID=A0A9P6DXC3_9AGAM|nr:hypothetical protein BS47DRAFT_1316810 [Hydnum rufescens UP504]
MRRLSRTMPSKRSPTSKDNALTLSWDELPEWMKDNEYIQRGYRKELRTIRGCISSVYGYFHNETVNIHSHLGGAALFCFLALVTHPYVLSVHRSVTWKDIMGMYVFIGAAVFCLLSSATYHCLTCHSRDVAKRCHALDYAGIVVLIVGSFFPTLHYGFFCDPLPHNVYLACICSAGLVAAYIVLSPTYSTPTYRRARTTVFVSLGLVGIIPVTHGLFAVGFSRLSDEMGLLWILLSAACYLNGALIYASRVPERWYPGTFDIFGSSHQIFHIHVLFAVVAHYLSLLTAINHRHGLHGGVCLV